ncbi:MAG: molecular chaperone DnaK [Armatimonadota bacterium]
MPERILGIDLGTTNSVMAVLEGGQPRIIPTAEGRPLCPSVVGFTPSGEQVVGDIAKRQLVTHPKRTIASVKRFIGTRLKITIDDRTYTPPEISAMILQKLHRDAEAYLGERITKAVITVPAYFSDAQRQATRDAGRIAGLDVLRIINEPTAAALAYGMDRRENQTVLAWDLGGGTFDVSLLTIHEGIFRVISTNGDTHLGGDDWDGHLMHHLVTLFAEREGIDLHEDRLALQRMKDAAEEAKIRLSTEEHAVVSLPFLATRNEKAVHLETTISRKAFEELTADLRKRMIAPTVQAIKDADMKPYDLDGIILVGGSTRMPAIQAMVHSVLLNEPIIGVNPDEVVALGAAIQGGIISGEITRMQLYDITPLSLGIETKGGVFTRIIPRNTPIPISASQMFTTGHDNQTSVEIHVLQGERDFAANNKSLGRFSLVGIAPAPRGKARIDVAFALDANGIVQITAIDQETGARQQVEVTASSGLTEEEIQAMIVESENYARLDQQQLALAELHDQAGQLLDALAKFLITVADRLPAGDRSRLHSGIQRMKAALEGIDTAEISAALDSLRDLSQLLVPYGVKLSSVIDDAPPPILQPVTEEAAGIQKPLPPVWDNLPEERTHDE